MKNNKFLSIILLIIYSLVGGAFTLLFSSAYTNLKNATSFNIIYLIEVILGVFGIIGVLILAILRLVKMIGGSNESK